MVRRLKTMPIKFNTEIITAAIQGFEFQKTSIDGKIAELSAMKLSAAGRAAIVAATKKRWEAVHKAQKAAVKAPAKKKMSPARKAALVANLAKARAARAAKRAESTK
jgi:hypothetical protein